MFDLLIHLFGTRRMYESVLVAVAYYRALSTILLSISSTRSIPRTPWCLRPTMPGRRTYTGCPLQRWMSAVTAYCIHSFRETGLHTLQGRSLQSVGVQHQQAQVGQELRRLRREWQAAYHRDLTHAWVVACYTGFGCHKYVVDMTCSQFGEGDEQTVVKAASHSFRMRIVSLTAAPRERYTSESTYS